MEASESRTIAILAEKPSVAQDIARVLGADKRGKGYLQGNGYVVTWAIGHLVSLAQPHEIKPEWRHWRFDQLPILPIEWPLVVYEKTKDQFEVVRKILTSGRVSRIVCATDAGREGELIFRYIYEAAGCRKPVSRLWISSLTPDAIRNGFDKLRPGSEYDRLADAACGRSRADWLVGMDNSGSWVLGVKFDSIRTTAGFSVKGFPMATVIRLQEPAEELLAGVPAGLHLGSMLWEGHLGTLFPVP